MYARVWIVADFFANTWTPTVQVSDGEDWREVWRGEPRFNERLAALDCREAIDRLQSK